MAILLACVFPVSGSVHAAVTGYAVAVPTVKNLTSSFHEKVDLDSGMDWVKHRGLTGLVRKQGENRLSVAPIGIFHQKASLFVPASGYQFSWAGGKPPAGGTDRIHANAQLDDGGGWRAIATGLAAGAYRLELWAARTDNTAFSVELLDGLDLLVRRTVDGAVSPDGVNTDAIHATVDFTVDGPADVVRVNFIRDVTHGANGTSRDNTGSGILNGRILAIGAWRLTAIPGRGKK